jgi:hypothetical protein
LADDQAIKRILVVVREFGAFNIEDEDGRLLLIV